jgi:adenylate cyclase
METVTTSAIATKPPVILVVDDEPDLEQLVTLKFRRRIRSGEVTFHFAHDGEEALVKLGEFPEIEMVVTDINMPNMDGLTLVKQLRTKHPLVKAVIVSAYGDIENIRSAMNRGAFDFLTKPLDFSDFELTVSKTVEYVRMIADTVRHLEENRIMRMFVDESVVHFMQRSGGNALATESEAADVSVAFIDICAFTAISERNSPAAVVDLLNRYFDVIVANLQPYGGVIDKFIGDAAMAVFRGDDHQERATRACLAVKTAVAGLRGEMEAAIGYFPNVSIGLNAGTVIFGPVGARSLGRLDFTIIGDVVNTAARLRGTATPGDIIVTAAFAGILDGRFELQDRGVQYLKGKAEPIQLFSVCGEKYQ